MTDAAHVLVHDGLPIMAAGLPALAEHLTRHGLPAVVWNRFAEQRAGQALELARDLAGVRLLGLSVHWFYQLPPALRLAREARAAGFDGTIVLGGFTASLFAAELLLRHGELDAVVRGDGEEPLRALAAALAGAGALAGVPNLTWRDGDEIRDNPLTYVGGPADIDALEFGALDRIRDLGAHFAASSWRAITDGSPGLPGDLERVLYLCGGRGCSVDCATCGGGREAQRLHSGRDQFSFRSPARLADDVQRGAALGCTAIHACFDPAPGGRHWIEFMRELASRGVRTSMLFECFGLPDRPFLERFAATFDGGGLILSPETADEAIRRRTRGFPHSNAELEQVLAWIGELGLRAQVFFGYFAPGEGLRELHRTRAYARALAQRHASYAEIFHFPYSTDPGAPLTRDPARWGVRCTMGSAADYERELARQEPWLGNLLRHEPDVGEPGEWSAVGLALELELACRREAPELIARFEAQLGEQLDAFFVRLARRLLAEHPAETLARAGLAGVVRREAEGGP